MTKLLLILSLTLGLTTAAQAGFISDRDGWKELPQLAKSFYAAGIFDGTTKHKETDVQRWRSFAEKLENCGITENVSPRTLADMIDNYYQDVSNWTHHPHDALLNSMVKFCNF